MKQGKGTDSRTKTSRRQMIVRKALIWQRSASMKAGKRTLAVVKKPKRVGYLGG